VLEVLESAIVVLCLDDDVPRGSEELVKAALHGHHWSPRHWDKVQLVVFGNGTSGVLLEHTPVDGHVSLRWLSHATDRAESNEPISESAVAAVDSADDEKDGIYELVFDGSKDNATHAAALAAAADRHHHLANSVDVAVLVHDRYGARRAKEAGVSPDALVQCAFQLAVWAVRGKTLSTYESCNTKHFVAGRTEVVRSVTAASAKMQREWNSDDDDDGGDVAVLRERRRELFAAAAAAHVQRVRAAQAGLGVDRHLGALTAIALQRRERVLHYQPSALLDGRNTALSTLTTSVISTSQVSAPFFDLFAFGPVAADGVGIAYNIAVDEVRITITSVNAGEASRLTAALADAFAQIDDALRAPTAAATDGGGGSGAAA